MSRLISPKRDKLCSPFRVWQCARQVLWLLCFTFTSVSYGQNVEQNDVSISSGAALSPEVVETGSYLINAGDVLSLQVWNEATLSDEQLLVRPDGFISAPVIGELRAGGKKLSELQEMVETALAKYLKDPPIVWDLLIL